MAAHLYAGYHGFMAAAMTASSASAPRFATLADRGVLALAGEDARPFVQGLISNDVDKLGPARVLYAALLTPQGKYLHDFILAECGGALLLDVERARAADLLRRLTLYRLRSKVTIEDRTQAMRVVVLPGEGAAPRFGLAREAGAARGFGGGAAFVDPRLPALGVRAIVPADLDDDAFLALGFAPGSSDDYERLRLEQGVPDGSRDILVDKSFLLESNFEELNGVDFDKGCYVGQELTSRTKFRGAVRRRLFKVAVDGPLPQPGTPILLGDREAGQMRSGQGARGLALLRLDLVDEARASGAPLVAGDARLTPAKPDWAAF